AQNEEEREMLHELQRRGKHNGSRVRIITDQEASEIEPNVKTYKQALYSPDTATINPKTVCHALKEDLEKEGVEFSFNTVFLKYINDHVITNQESYFTKKLINCAGLYADKIAHAMGFGRQYTLIPFKGLYLKYTKNKTDVRTNIYPVPNLKNPFLGVHFTKTVDGEIKIGPTAIPAFWRENYNGFDRFDIAETLEVFKYESQLFFQLPAFRNLAFEEIRKYNKTYFIQLAQRLVQSIDPAGFTEFTKPGIRAQLIDIQANSLVQDFVVEADAKNIHILNAVSPAYTCAFPFARYVCQQYL
ncbi:MAG: FAD-dependent oxidoreductase, partial [Candidatus Omnitrophica bacterium]|nr:FAD-dependent oxidoreductase [Candidatus Omnitrophota bacterium]